MSRQRALVLTALACAACSGNGATDAGSCWLGRDAGSCTDDSQCPTGDYCDFSSFETCVWDGGTAPPGDSGWPWGPFGRAVGGTCLPDCGRPQNYSCETAEDCQSIYACWASYTKEVDCTREAPCPGGGVCSISGTPGPPFCPPDAGCKAEAAPHLRSGSYCDCPNLTCGK